MENTSNSSAKDGTAVEVYGSFLLGDSELAIAVDMLQEVVDYPSNVTRSPLSPEHLLGIFNLRGTLIPIVDLRGMLDIAGEPCRASSKIAIVNLGETCVGLMFDATREILRVQASENIMFEQADGAKGVIGGCLKLDEGERIVQILSVSALLGIPEVPHMRQRGMSVVRRAPQRQTVAFRVGDTQLALPMEGIREIVRVPSMHPSPLGDALCVGMLNLRGDILPVIDFARLIGVGTTSADPSVDDVSDDRRIVILKDDAVYFGLLVDEVSRIVGYRDDQLLAMPSYAQRHVDWFAGCLADDDGGSLILLKPDALCGYARIKQIAHGHRQLYKDRKVEALGNKGTTRGSRETWVTFRLDQLFGVPIGRLREVIDLPDEIVATPGLPKHVLGVLNLRHELVTLLDVRTLFDMPALANREMAKVLIVELQGEKHGLVVDGLDNIVTLDTAKRIGVPAVLKQQAGQRLAASLDGCIEVPGCGTMMLMIDLEAVCRQGAHALAA
ncbi:chemotaxis protein CheW [Trinickia dinghuensis]|uniref:CheW-like domain-containing protein n=1 Tax=Trinickia dinghuensis TaxID=2291023 RepID=A0A3D8JX34_9BURK|nr:chemotaxis protein CheW [Trinickia dinghuensis]RDU97609.1 hypothetical protein DWV00_17175 [Trinickia dinghuensis]